MKETFQTPPFTNRWRKLLVFGYLEIAGELMRANCKSRSISAPDFLHKQSGTPRRGPVPESGIRGNHAGAAPVSMGMIPRSMLGGCVTGCLLLLSLSLPHALGATDIRLHIRLA